jgi:hypothetical protein
MHIETVEATRGVQVMVDGRLHTAEFSFKVAEIEDINDAEKRASELAEKATERWLDTIDPNGILIISGETAKQVQKTAPVQKSAQQGELVELIFEATNSKPRSDRIMRATTEEMSFEPSPDFNGWVCTSHNGRQFRVNVDKLSRTGRCDCEDFVNRGAKSKMPCKHIYALLMSSERFWENRLDSGQVG